MRILGVVVGGYIAWAIAHEINYYRKDRVKQRLPDIGEAAKNINNVFLYVVFLKNCTGHRNGWGKEYLTSSSYQGWVAPSVARDQVSSILKEYPRAKKSIGEASKQLNAQSDMLDFSRKLGRSIRWNAGAYPAAILRHSIRWITGKPHDGYTRTPFGYLYD